MSFSPRVASELPVSPLHLRALSGAPPTTCAGRLGVLALINVANLCCHAVYSLLPAFFPAEAAQRGMSNDFVGVIFASFAGVACVCSPIASTLMIRHGQKRIYLYGLLLVALATIAFGMTAALDGVMFASTAVALRLLQGIGSALEETAAYAIIAGIDTERTSLYLGLCELSTGLGYAVGPILGGSLYARGGYVGPFATLGLTLLPAAALIWWALPAEAKQDGEETTGDEEADSSATVLRCPGVRRMLLVCALSNYDYALLEPTLGAHAMAHGLADNAEAVGVLFAISAAAYTICCPIFGWLANGSLLGPRVVVLAGLALQVAGFALIGPSPLLLGLTAALGFPADDLGRVQLLGALVCFGAGEAAAMTPVMEDMRGAFERWSSSPVSEDVVINTLSGAMASAFAFGQMTGPLVGASLTARIGFDWTTTCSGIVLLGVCTLLIVIDRGGDSKSGDETVQPRVLW